MRILPRNSNLLEFKENATLEKKQLTVPFKLSKEVSEAGEFEGFAAVFGNVDLGNDVVEKGAFLESLAEWKAAGQLPLLTFRHDFGDVIGDLIELNEVDEGLFARGKLWIKGDKRIENAVMVNNLLLGTGPKGMSFTFTVKSSHDEVVEGENIRHLDIMKIFEVGIVPFGMNPLARVTNAKSLFGEDGKIADIRTVEKILRDAGFSATAAKTLLSGGYESLKRDVSTYSDSGKENLDRDGLKSLTQLLNQSTDIFKR